MITKVIIIVLILATVVVIAACSVSRKTERSLLFENTVYDWKVYFVKENNFPAGTDRYYEVFYKGEKLVLPKEITGGVRDIGRFITAAALDISHTHNDAVLIV